MSNSYFKGIPWEHFQDFISPLAIRFTVLKELLEESKLAYRVLEIAGNRHFLVTPPAPGFSGSRPPVILVAHYDRAEGSPRQTGRPLAIAASKSNRAGPDGQPRGETN